MSPYASPAGARTSRVRANGIDFAVLEAGSGPLALCLHGFPDSAHTWRHLLPELAEAGFHAVAPFMRGYAPTGLSPDGDYATKTLGEDAIGLHEVLGDGQQALLIGSDWGAEAAYWASILEPQRWSRLVTLAIPPPGLDERLFTDFEQLRRFFYFFVLQAPHGAALAAAEDMRFFDWLWAAWSPGFDPGESLASAKECLRDPANLSAAIDYYRANGPTDPSDGASRSGPVTPPIAPTPTLYLHGERDGCIDVSLCTDAGQHLAPGSRMETIAGAGHFIQIERPGPVNESILAWARE